MITVKEPRLVWQLQCNDDGVIPNSKFPALIYESAFAFSNRDTVEADLTRAVEKNAWRLAWTWRVYKFNHWHSTAHEGLLCIRGSATILLGGPRVGGPVFVQTGDMVLIPAGVAHRNMKASEDFAVCGIYPDGQTWDLVKGANTVDTKARRRVSKVPLPADDPLYGKRGPLTKHWK